MPAAGLLGLAGSLARDAKRGPGFEVQLGAWGHHEPIGYLPTLERESKTKTATLLSDSNVRTSVETLATRLVRELESSTVAQFQHLKRKNYDTDV